jgi:hypothetical protein
MKSRLLRLCGACTFILALCVPSVSFAATNLITNPGFETGDTSGWSASGSCPLNDIIYGNEDHNNCYEVFGGGHTGDYHLGTSYDWAVLSQEIDLSAKGYSASTMDAQPDITTGIWVASGSGTYHLVVNLLDADHNTLASFDTGDQLSSNDWTQITHTFTGYGTGVRYIYYEIDGKDTLYWSGHFGVAIDDASLTIVPPAHALQYNAGAGGSVTGSTTQAVDDGTNGTSVTAVPFPGYEFSSWSDASTSNPRIDTSVTTDMQVTAQFNQVNYNLLFDSQGGTSVPSSSQYASTTVTLPAGPIKHGSVFSGWNTTSDGSGTMYRSGSSFFTPIGDTTLYTIWTAAPSSHTGSSVKSQVATLMAMGNTTLAQQITQEWPQLFVATTTPIPTSTPYVSSHIVFNQDLQKGSIGEGIRSLQKFLNNAGYLIAASGLGSPGSESTLFGSLTKAALAKFQQAHNISPATGYFGSKTRAVVASQQ